MNDASLRSLFAALDGAGEELRVVGGAVRDALLDRVVADVDLATTALPDEVCRRAEAAGFKVALTGFAHGTVTVIVEGRPFEVTTLRRDVATDGRHATVAFGRDWMDDARRRDFTINALSLDAAGRVHDYVGGQEDIAARRVRFIGDARARIREDYLRILRFFRFHALCGEGAADAEALRACAAEREGLARLSRERVRAEFLKLLMTPRAVEVVGLMDAHGFLQAVLGGEARVARFQRMAALPGSDAVQRLAALALDAREDAVRLAERLRLSREEAGRLETMAGPLLSPDMDEAEAKALLYRLGGRAYRDRVMLAAVEAPSGLWDALLSLPERWTAPVFPLKGADVLALGLAPGPQMGAVLKRAEEAWIVEGFPGREEALLLLKNILNA